jgi:hypothetical protein
MIALSVMAGILLGVGIIGLCVLVLEIVERWE